MKQILVVEDNAPLCWLIERMLRGIYIVRVMNNGLDAMAWLQDGNKVDAIITDLQMPLFGGLELLHCVKQSGLYSDTPVIVLSAMADKEDECVKGGASAYILKPFDPQKLISVIRTILSEQPLASAGPARIL